MRMRGWFVSLSILTISAIFEFAAPAIAVEGHDCSGSPSDAVITLPMPLAKWGQIICTPVGHVLANHDGWIWIRPDARGTVYFSSRSAAPRPGEVDNNSYFTRIEVQQVKGQEFDEAYGTFHSGFDEKEVKPDAYRVDLTSVSGTAVRLFFFDYDTYAWGMRCPDNTCDPDTRFMVLDKNHRPEPRQPPI